MIAIKNLVKKYDDLTVLKNINTVIKKGEVISIIGPSGTGKSTLLRCINLLEEPNSGSILIDGKNILDPKNDRSKLRRKMGMVFQSFNLFSHLTIMDNLTIGPMKLLGKKREQAERRGFELLTQVGLADKAGNLPDELSGGQKQRVAIARCLSMEPEIILFDEPTSALDPTMISEVLAVIRRLAKEGMTMAIVTHEMDFARDVSHRVFYMDEGIIYEEGPPEQIFENPQKEKTRNFIQRLRNFSYEIHSSSFDLYAMNGEIIQFCEKHFFSRKMQHNTLLVVEECTGLYFTMSDPAPLTLILSYSEKSAELQVLLDYGTHPQNFLENVQDGDDLGMKILKGLVHDLNWEWNDKHNRVSMILNS